MSILAQHFAHLLPASETAPPADLSEPAPPADLSEPPIFTKGKRNALNVIFNGFRHCKDGKHKESSYFRCVNQVPKCSGRLTLVGDQVTKYTPHSCQPEPSQQAVHIIRDNIKNTVATTSTGTKKAVAIHLRGYIDEEVRQELPPNYVLTAQARRHRKKTNNHPTNPTSLENLTVPAEFLATDPL